MKLKVSGQQTFSFCPDTDNFLPATGKEDIKKQEYN